MDDLFEKYLPSQPCGCEICRGFCRRPGWWAVGQAEEAVRAGYSRRMMLEISPKMDFGVLSPAFKGNEAFYSLNIYAGNGCTFFKNSLCELHSTQYLPLECGYCHHDRLNLGIKCHRDIETQWKTEKGQKLVRRWRNIVGLWGGYTNAQTISF
jgi:hypothetical protein